MSRTKFITLVIYDSVGEFRDNRAAVKLNGFWGVIDYSGTCVVPARYIGFSDAINGIFVAKNIDNAEIFDYNGKRLSTLKGHYDYTGMEYLYHWVLPVKGNGRWGFFDIKAGRFRLPVKYKVSMTFFRTLPPSAG